MKKDKQNIRICLVKLFMGKPNILVQWNSSFVNEIPRKEKYFFFSETSSDLSSKFWRCQRKCFWSSPCNLDTRITAACVAQLRYLQRSSPGNYGSLYCWMLSSFALGDSILRWQLLRNSCCSYFWFLASLQWSVIIPTENLHVSYCVHNSLLFFLTSPAVGLCLPVLAYLVILHLTTITLATAEQLTLVELTFVTCDWIHERHRVPV
jgi:hypothetical protein